jgi:hypothetical protein
MLVVLAAAATVACAPIHRYRVYTGPELPPPATAVLEGFQVAGFYANEGGKWVQRLGGETCCGKVHLTMRPGLYRVVVRSGKVAGARCIDQVPRRCRRLGELFADPREGRVWLCRGLHRSGRRGV